MSAPVASKSTYETELPSPFGWARSLVLLCPLHRQRNRYACRAARCWRNAANWINPTLASSSLNPKLRRSSTYSSTLLRHEVTVHLLARAKPTTQAKTGPPWRRSPWSAGCDAVKARRSQTRTLLPGASDRQVHAGTGGLPCEPHQSRPERARVLQWSRFHIDHGNLLRALSPGETRIYCWRLAVRAANNQRWPRRHRSAAVVENTGQPSRAP